MVNTFKIIKVQMLFKTSKIMRILFLCGSVEPGKDGVGDYTRCLATELVKGGNRVILIGLYDRYVTKSINTAQYSEGVCIEVIRIPSSDSLEERAAKAKDVVQNFNPDWISLQYVPSSFHLKGLNIRLPFLLAQIKGKHKWHIMIHEPWLVSCKALTGIRIWVSWIQKKLLKFLIYKIRPKVIHTSNLYYREILEGGGVFSSILPLPGNIPVYRRNDSKIPAKFAELGISNTYGNEWIVLGTFGQIRPNIDYVSFFRAFLKTPEAKGKSIAFLSIGKAGKHCETTFERIKEKFNRKILLYKFGERSPEDISSFFQLLDYGVASLPDHLLGKSGAYSTMRNHGLKILVPENKAKGDKIGNSAYSNYLLNLSNKEFSPIEVGRKFINSLTQNSSNGFLAN